MVEKHDIEMRDGMENTVNHHRPVVLPRPQYVKVADALSEVEFIRRKIMAIARVMDDKSLLDEGNFDITQRDCYAFGSFLFEACNELDRVAEIGEELKLYG